jgi:hypothetical protein
LQPIWSQLPEKLVRFEDSFVRSKQRFEPALGSRPRHPKGAERMTEFNADRTSSNKTGVTLMDNQVGHVVAEVMRGKENVTVTVLPSMIRVDGVGKVEFDPSCSSPTRRTSPITSASTSSR